IVTVAASSDASCVNVTNPLVTDSSTSSSAPLSTAFTSVPSTAAAPGASGNPGSNGGLPSGHNSAGPIAGGIVAGVVALLLLLLLAFWWRRKSKRQDLRSSFKTELDVRAEHNGMVVEPFLPDAQMFQTTSSSLPSQPTYEAPLPSSSPTSAPRKHTRPPAVPAGPVQESDAGVRLMGGVRQEQLVTLPPAYDNSWRE
ncbi:hypothetical protein FRC10_009384, partial [Ceratobasidium sp. 414]